MSYWWPISIAMVGTARLGQLCSHSWWHEGKAVVRRKLVYAKHLYSFQGLLHLLFPLVGCVSLIVSSAGAWSVEGVRCGSFI